MTHIRTSKYIIFILLLICSMPMLDAMYPAKLDGVSRVIPITVKMILLISLFLYFIQCNKKWWFNEGIGKAISIFFFIHATYFVLTSNNYVGDFFQLSKTAIWYFGFFFFLDIGFRERISEKVVYRFFLVSIIFIFILVFQGVTEESFFKANREYGASNFAYYLLFCLPFIFMFKRVSLRVAIFALVSIGVAISMKRGTMILYAIMVFYLLFFSNLRHIAGKNFSVTFRVLIVFVISLVVYELVLSNLNIYENKFADFSELGSGGDLSKFGSGRGALYLLPLNHWLDANIFNFLLGFGHNSVPDFYPTTGLISGNLYAHSDFVMIIFDYGLIGLSVLLYFFWLTYKQAINTKQMINRVPVFLVFLALFFKSIFSGFIVYEYSIFAFAVLGLIVGRQRRELFLYSRSSMKSVFDKQNVKKY
jgi:hypothetical protein